MTRKKMYIIIGGMLVAAVVVIMILKLAFKVNLIPTVITNNFGPKVKPPETTSSPRSLTPGVQTWTGILTLDKSPSINVGGKYFALSISGKDTFLILEAKGYKNGDTINVVGSLSGSTIIMSGLNKLVK